MARLMLLAVVLLGCGAGRQLFVVDRVEEGVAVLLGDGEEWVEVPLSELPEGAAEGAVISDGVIDPVEREERRRALAARRERLRALDDGADLSLEGRP